VKLRLKSYRLIAFFLLLASTLFAEFRQPLDAARDFTVELRQSKDGQWVAVITAYKSDSRISTPEFLATIQKGLKVTVAGKEVPVQWGHSGTRPAETPTGQVHVELFGTNMKDHTLSSYDLREFGQRGIHYVGDWSPLPTKIDKRLFTKIDLHTHMAGSFNYRSLMEVAKNHHIPYPISLLQELGIRYPKNRIKTENGRQFIPMNELLGSREWKESNGEQKFQEALSIGRTRIRNFTQMEDRYRFRSPLTKNRDAVEDLLWMAARDAKAAGVNYTEFSIADVLDPKWLKRAHEILPTIEEKTGVKIRFLVGLWRHSDESWNMDEIEKVRHLAKNSPYIVGVDWMGHETNSTKELKNQIEKVKQMAPDLAPHFQIRVHAGENILYPENLAEAIKLGATRIGHGLYSDLDEATLKIIRDRNIIIELNPLSNHALNNLSSDLYLIAKQFKKYRAAGVRVTFGTDGSGMYGGSVEETYRMMRQLGLTEEDIAYAKASDDKYLQEIESDFKAKKEKPGSLEVDPNLPAPKFWNQELQDQKDLQRAEKIKAMNENLGAKGIEKITNESSVIKGMRPIMITGSSMSHFPEIEKQGKVAEIEKLAEKLIEQLDPKKDYLVTGGTQFGVEKIYHIKAREKGIIVVGVLPEEANPEEVFGPKQGGITHWMDGGKTWYSKGPIQYALVADNRGDIIAIGGKNILADELATIKNAEGKGGARLHLMKGIVGASGDLAQRLPDSSFSNAKELLARLNRSPALAPGCDAARKLSAR
jgi:adenosine deaminase